MPEDTNSTMPVHRKVLAKAIVDLRIAVQAARDKAHEDAIVCAMRTTARFKFMRRTREQAIELIEHEEWPVWKIEYNGALAWANCMATLLAVGQGDVITMSAADARIMLSWLEGSVADAIAG